MQQPLDLIAISAFATKAVYVLYGFTALAALYCLFMAFRAGPKD